MDEVIDAEKVETLTDFSDVFIIMLRWGKERKEWSPHTFGYRTLAEAQKAVAENYAEDDPIRKGDNGLSAVQIVRISGLPQE